MSSIDVGDDDSVLLQEKLIQKDLAIMRLCAHRSTKFIIVLTPVAILFDPKPTGCRIFPVSEFNDFFREYYVDIKNYFMGHRFAICHLYSNGVAVKVCLDDDSPEMRLFRHYFNQDLVWDLEEYYPPIDRTLYDYDSN